ncbi:MAG: 1-deoxy-11-beta-hydroxypentalenate dehydrogenase [Tenericutes bacterium ADurb.Bin087]|nr:MAG: 1-deoxy-11-beta-hydroxypentalenate dehydrogenase [Tenericutes bacterium ADurb.Bin087]
MRVKKFLAKIPSLENKTYVITGANSGLGFALSCHLVSKGARVIMANRSAKRSAEAIEKLLAKFPSAKVSVFPFDQSKKATIETFVNTLISHNIKLDGVVFNAGVYWPALDAKTENGVALTFGVNFVGNYILTQTLANRGLITAKTRLIYITSPAAVKKLSPKLLARVKSGQKMTRLKQYAVTKAALNTFVLGLMHKDKTIPFEVKGQAYLYHPGISESNIARFKWKFFNKIAHGFMRTFFHSPEQAVLGGLLALVTDKDMNGKMFVPKSPLETSGFPRVKKIDEKLLSHLSLLMNETQKLI